MSYHAKLSPSSSERWSTCTASIAAEEGRVDNGNMDAWTGTCGHQMCAEVLTGAVEDLQSYLGRKMLFWLHPESDSDGEHWADESITGNAHLDILGEVIVTQELIDACDKHVRFVREQVTLLGAELFVEERLPVEHITGEVGATGSGDVVLIAGRRLIVVDLKLGRKPVLAYKVITPAHLDIVTNEPVPEETAPNTQMAMYASGAIEKFDLLDEIEDVTLIISQPFLGPPSQWSGSRAQLDACIATLRAAAERTRTDPQYAPSSENCKYCKANGDCVPQSMHVLSSCLDMFDDVTTAKPKYVPDIGLGQAYALLPMINDWAKAIDQRVYSALHAGVPVTRSDGLHYKLVTGKKSARAWKDATAVEDLLVNHMRLKEDIVYSKSLRSPTQLEEMAKVPKVKKGETPKKPLIGKTRWAKLQEHIRQGAGSPTVVLSTDPRPPISSADGFADEPPEDNSDLF